MVFASLSSMRCWPGGAGGLGGLSTYLDWLTGKVCRTCGACNACSACSWVPSGQKSLACSVFVGELSKLLGPSGFLASEGLQVGRWDGKGCGCFPEPRSKLAATMVQRASLLPRQALLVCCLAAWLPLVDARASPSGTYPTYPVFSKASVGLGGYRKQPPLGPP